MTKNYFLSICILLLGWPLVIYPQQKGYRQNDLDLNYISMPLNNYGYIGKEKVIWERYGRQLIVYDQGLFFIGKINQEIYLSEAMWGHSLYSPGPIINGQAAMVYNSSDSLKYRIYKATVPQYTGSPPDPWTQDVNDWPVEWGAPSMNNKLKIYGDQMLWAVYNTYDTTTYSKWKTRELYPAFLLEVNQNVYNYASGSNPDTLLDDVILLEYTIINKGPDAIDSAVVGMWTDIDFIAPNNIPAVDTVLQLGYCWSNYIAGTNSVYPAVGYVQLFGPAVPSPGDTAIFKGELRKDYRNLQLSAFWGVSDDSYPDTSSRGPAYSRETAWNIARGLDKLGRDIIDPYTNLKTTFGHAGDPVTNTGWLYPYPTGGGAGFYIFSGPFNLAPNDTQWVMYALLSARGGDNLKSITELRHRTEHLRSLEYSELVKFTLLDFEQVIDPNYFKLYQNYPNPFNGITRIEYGTTVEDNIDIIIYNSLGERIRIINRGFQRPGIYRVDLDLSEFASGVYFCCLRAGSRLETKKMILMK